MSEINRQELAALLERWSGRPVVIERLTTLGQTRDEVEALKGFGYGEPVQITFREVGNPAERQAVLRRVKRNGFGREQVSDRAAEVWRDYQTFNRLPRHVPAYRLVLQREDGRLDLLEDPEELLLLTGYVPGKPYAHDLFHLRQSGTGSDLDRRRVLVLAEYLASVHAVKHDDPLLWRRRLRDLVGDGEGIMGLADSYPAADPILSREELLAIETEANRWRWQLKPLSHRLSQVHGDFHPFNILFDGETDLYLVDRSRGEWGAPEDDVSCLTINFLFFSLARHGRLEGIFAELYHRFWERYLELTGDTEMGRVIAPWYAWRALVLASPIWYPDNPPTVREKLYHFARSVLTRPVFHWKSINRYLNEKR